MTGTAHGRRPIDAVLHTLACPHCHGQLDRGGAVLGCPNGHRFDIARQGHVALLGPRSRTDTGDSAEMVTARADFLADGHYAPIASAIQNALEGRSPGVLIEVGAGTGYYLGSALDGFPNAVGVAIDSSARAARRAATAHHRIGSVVADAWSRLPISDNVADVVLSVFAPRNAAELARIIDPDGLLVVVSPGPRHLGELIGPLRMLTVGSDKDNRLAQSFAGTFTAAGSHHLRFAMTLIRSQVRNLVLMGPSARHLEPAFLEAAIAQLPDLSLVTADLRVSRWVRSSRS